MKLQNSRIKVFLTIFPWWWKDPEPDPYLWLSDSDADPGGPKTYHGSYGSGSPTLEEIRKCYNSYGTMGVLGRSLKILHRGLRENFYCIYFFVLDCDFLLFSNSFAYFAYFVDTVNRFDPDCCWNSSWSALPDLPPLIICSSVPRWRSSISWSRWPRPVGVPVKWSPAL